MINFSDKYDDKKFKLFLKQFLPEDLLEKNEVLEVDEGNEYFKKAILLSSVKSLGGLVIIEVERKRSEKSRITITKELFKFLNIHGYSKALVVTFSKKESHYRFSLVTSDLNWVGSNVHKEFSNPKRLSFLLGLGSKVHTATRHLVEQGKIKDFKDLYSRFNIEIINDEFYQHYKDLYINLKDNLDKDKEFSSFAKKINLENGHFAKKLLGQIVFCYFLQKKGWLGVDKDKSFGTGKSSFLRNKFEEYKKNKQNFFNYFLEFFFYKGLNNQNENDFVKEINCRVPYVGGGLFEYYDGYDWQKEILNIPNTTFSNSNNNGILDIFELYNFTVDENETIDVEISIDPEMLGRVFENLLDENIRKKGGSFYTPRSIVNFMCEDVLINHLYNKSKDKLSFLQISNFIKDKKFDISKNEIIKNNAVSIDHLLEDIKICDPAIGSGAFAVGIINLISKLRVSLKDFTERKYKNTSYYFKRDCIQNSIYGVDIDASAVEIAKLRLWLSLIVDEDDYIPTEALPNLDFKIIQGNSLLETFENFKLGDTIFEDSKKINTFEDHLGKESTKSLLIELADLQSLFFKTISYNKKQKLKKEIQEKIFNIFKTNIETRKDFNKDKINHTNIELNELISGRISRNFFPWKIFFSEVFLKNNGFDIVIGNPPYIGVKEIMKLNWRDNLKENFGFIDDLYSHFTFLALFVCKDNGVVSFITSDTFMTLQTKLNLRKKILQNTILSIVPTPKAFSAMVDTCIFSIQKRKYEKNYKFNFLDFKNLDELSKESTQNNEKPKWEFLLNLIFSSTEFQNKQLTDSDTYINNINNVFFNPNKNNLKINSTIIPIIKKVYDKYWEAIKTSSNITKNIKIINKYNSELKEKDLTLLGLVTNGGQGLATGNNGDFVGCIEGSNEAKRVFAQRPVKLFLVVKKYTKKLHKKFPELIKLDDLESVKDYLSKINEQKIRELFFSIKQFLGRDVFGQGFLYRIISQDEVMKVDKMTSEEKSQGIKIKERIYVKYDKGDKEGNRWIFETPYLIKWNYESLNFLKTNSLARWQGYNFFFKNGFCWSDIHTTYLKCRLKNRTVNDVKSMSLTSINPNISDKYLVCIINSSFISNFQQNFLNNTASFQINDARRLPIVVPTKKISKQFINIFDSAEKVKNNFLNKKISFDEQIVRLSNIENENDLLVEKIYDF